MSYARESGRRRNLLGYLLLGAALTIGLVAGYSVLGGRGEAGASSDHIVSARASAATTATVATSGAPVAVGATRTPVPGTPLQTADLASLQKEMEYLEQQLAALQAAPSGSSTPSGAALAELQQLIVASEVALAQLDALIAQRADGPSAAIPSRPGVGSAAPAGQTQPGSGLHGHH